MNDLLILALTLLFAGLTTGLLWICQRLMEETA
jgi:hypothetical protein